MASVRELLSGSSGSCHDPLSAGYALGDALLTWGEPGAALEEADGVLAALPEAGVVLYLRARALAALGRKEEALEAYQRALRVFPAHGYETSPFDSLIAETLEAAPTPSKLAFGAEHSARAGRIDEARERAYRALAQYGLLAPAELQEYRTVASFGAVNCVAHATLRCTGSAARGSSRK